MRALALAFALAFASGCDDHPLTVDYMICAEMAVDHKEHCWRAASFTDSSLCESAKERLDWLCTHPTTDSLECHKPAHVALDGRSYCAAK